MDYPTSVYLDLDLTRQDIQSLNSADAITAFFARLGSQLVYFVELNALSVRQGSNTYSRNWNDTRKGSKQSPFCSRTISLPIWRSD